MEDKEPQLATLTERCMLCGRLCDRSGLCSHCWLEAKSAKDAEDNRRLALEEEEPESPED